MLFRGDSYANLWRTSSCSSGIWGKNEDREGVIILQYKVKYLQGFQRLKLSSSMTMVQVRHFIAAVHTRLAFVQVRLVCYKNSSLVSPASRKTRYM